MLEVRTKEEFTTVINSHHLVLVDFFATWCGPCKMLAPILEELAHEVHGLKVIKVNVENDELVEVVQHHNVSGMPTLVFYKNGHEYTQHIVGMKNKSYLLDFINNLLGH